jgi:hypothetical protein
MSKRVIKTYCQVNSKGVPTLVRVDSEMTHGITVTLSEFKLTEEHDGAEFPVSLVDGVWMVEFPFGLYSVQEHLGDFEPTTN